MRLLHVQDGVSGLGGRQTYLDEFLRRSGAEGWDNELCLLSDLEDSSALLHRYGPDAVVTHAATGWGRLARACGAVPCVAWAHNHDSYCPGGMSWYPSTGQVCERHTGGMCLLNAYRRGCAPRRPDRLLARSATARRTLAGSGGLCAVLAGSSYMVARLEGAGVAADLIELVPFFSRWDPAASPEPPPTGSSRPMIFCPTRLHPTKGLGVVIAAMAAVTTPTELVIAGSGDADYVRALEALAAGVTTHRVTVVDKSGDELREMYLRCTAVVVPSLWPEPFGLIGLEAMAFARPVVAFDVGGISDWLRHGEVGLLAEPGDASALGSCIEQVISSPQTASAMGLAGHRRVQEHFSWSDHIHKFDAAIRPRL